MKERSLAIGSTLAAFLTSLCCLGPLLLGGAGLGAMLVATFGPLRPYFLTLSGVLLAGGFYFVYRKPKADEGCGGQVCAPQSRAGRMAKLVLWLATLAVFALAAFPFYGSKLVAPRATAGATGPAQLATAELKIDGMDCEVCAGIIQRELLETRGVARAEVRYPAGSATVKYDPATTSPAQILAAVGAAGYKASLVR